MTSLLHNPMSTHCEYRLSIIVEARHVSHLCVKIAQHLHGEVGDLTGKRPGEPECSFDTGLLYSAWTAIGHYIVRANEEVFFEEETGP